MWLYVAVAVAIVAAITLPLVAGARVVALSVARPYPVEREDALDPELRALIERYR